MYAVILTRNIRYLLTLIVKGYYEEGNNFGVVKKGKYKAASDFRFEFVAEVICEDPHSSGFMVQLTPDRPEGASQEYEADGSARYVCSFYIISVKSCEVRVCEFGIYSLMCG